MASVFGGHAVMATGDLNMTDTPYERANGVKDSTDLAIHDFLTWGQDANADWVRIYVPASRPQIYDWVTSMGVSFEMLGAPDGNSVPRLHRTKGRGIALVSPIYRQCLLCPNITFAFNTRADRLLVEGGRVTGIAATSLRTGQAVELRAQVVVLATGGFQNNLEMVRQFWSKSLPFPPRILLGSGVNSVGSGLKLAQAVGAQLSRLDHQENLVTGLPDPRYPGSGRGLNASNSSAIMVNADGVRFMNERSNARYSLPIVLHQKGATYWSIFDEAAKHTFWIAGSDWGDFNEIEKWIFSNPGPGQVRAHAGRTGRQGRPAVGRARGHRGPLQPAGGHRRRQRLRPLRAREDLPAQADPPAAVLRHAVLPADPQEHGRGGRSTPPAGCSTPSSTSFPDSTRSAN